MKRVVLSSKADEIRRKKEERLSDYNSAKSRYQQQEKLYEVDLENEKKTKSEALKEYILDVAGIHDSRFSSCLQIRLDTPWTHAMDKNYYEVRIEYGEYSDNVNISLRWRWEISIYESGELKRDSSSWSGIDAVDKPHIEDLENSVTVLKTLVFMSDEDWKRLISRSVRPGNYITEEIPLKPNTDDLDLDLQRAIIEDAIESGDQVFGPMEGRYYKSAYLKPLRVTSKQMEVQEFGIIYDYSSGSEYIREYGEPYRMKFDRISSEYLESKLTNLSDLEIYNL